MMTIKNVFEIGQVVYLKTDVDQLPHLVSAFRVSSSAVLYELLQNKTCSEHYAFEISLEPDVILKTSN